MRVSALVVDLAVLGAHGWDYLDRVCSEMPSLAVVVCTGQSTVAQRVRGLRIGADDWLTKPCHPEELIARIEAVVRRRRRSEARSEGPVQAGELEIRTDQFQAFVGGSSVELTRREFELIDLLSKAEGRVLEREEIYQRVWGYAMARGDRSVDVFVRKLRQKLEKASPEWVYIHTHFGVGYRFAPESVHGEPRGRPGVRGSRPGAAAGRSAGSRHVRLARVARHACEVLRNVAIIFAIAAAVHFIPGGGDTAEFVAALLFIATTAIIIWIVARLYRENRVAIFSLGDQNRALLYGAIGVAVFAMAAREKLFDTGAGTIVWFAHDRRRLVRPVPRVAQLPRVRVS